MLLVTKPYLDMLIELSSKKGYPTPKYIQFCEYYLSRGFIVKLYVSNSTVSKYVFIIQGNKQFKVRFSNHKPNYIKENKNDCDFFVGVSNKRVTTTEQAIVATNKYFELP